MKLANLRGAIRKTKGPFSLEVPVAGKRMIVFPLKNLFLEELGKHFEGDEETGMTFDPETSVISITGQAPAPTAPAPVEDDDEFDLDLDLDLE